MADPTPLESDLRDLSRVAVPATLADAVMADVARQPRALWTRFAIGAASFGMWALVIQQAIVWTAGRI